MITFDQSVSVHFNGDEIKLLHNGPGHTDGDSVIYFPRANVVHMGDLFFNGGFPFVDLRNGGSVEGYIKGVAAVLDKAPADVKIIPGHGELATVDDLKQFYVMLLETTRYVKKGMSEGQSLADLKASGLPEKWKDWGGGFINTERWIETIYNDSDK